MAKNSNNREGVFLAPASGRVIAKNVHGSTLMAKGSHRIDHAWGPLHPAVDRENVAVSTKPANLATKAVT